MRNRGRGRGAGRLLAGVSGPGDFVRPTIISITIQPSGTSAIFLFSESVIGFTDVANIFFFNDNTQEIGGFMGYSSGDGTRSVTYTCAGVTVHAGDDCEVSYNGTSVRDLSNNKLATFGATTITNNSTQ